METKWTSQGCFNDMSTRSGKERIALLAQYKIYSECWRARKEPSLRYILFRTSVLAKLLNEYNLEECEAQKASASAVYCAASDKSLCETFEQNTDRINSNLSVAPLSVNIETV